MTATTREIRALKAKLKITWEFGDYRVFAKYLVSLQQERGAGTPEEWGPGGAG